VLGCDDAACDEAVLGRGNAACDESERALDAAEIGCDDATCDEAGLTDEAETLVTSDVDSNNDAAAAAC